MKTRTRRAMPRGSAARAELVERLRERRGEIEAAITARMLAITDPQERSDPEYIEGLRASVGAALEYGLEGIAQGVERAPPVPALLLRQARLAARNSVGLDMVFRRYFAGYALLGDFIVYEAAAAGLLDGPSLSRPLRSEAALFDCLLAAVGEEYRKESGRRSPSLKDRRTRCIERLLAGELLDAADLEYDLEAHHLAVIASGSQLEEGLREIAPSLDCSLLLLGREEDVVWAWFGSRQLVSVDELVAALGGASLVAHLALGEPGAGLAGWRLSHRQAQAAFTIALRGGSPLVRYGDVGLLTAVLQDEVLAVSLHRLYLDPLAAERDGGETLRMTLCAYFAAHRNAASTAAALGVSRQTVNVRLRTAEQRIGMRLTECTPDLELALRMHDLEVGPSDVGMDLTT